MPEVAAPLCRWGIRFLSDQGAEMAESHDAACVSLLWLEITGKCQLECVHCYAESGPDGDHGLMTRQDWLEVIAEARDIGVKTVVFIGGEPTLHPLLGEFVEYALGLGLSVRIVTNLVHVPTGLWDVYVRPGVSVSVSYYSSDPAAHDAMTRRRGSHRRTVVNLEKAARLGVHVTGLIITTDTSPDADPARNALERLGVRQQKVAPVQALGRAAAGCAPSLSDLCGQCAGHLLAVDPRGRAFPCVMARWLPVGDVRGGSLAAIVRDGRLTDVRRRIHEAFDPRVTGRPPVVLHHGCEGNSGGQDGCGP
ncbi:radical SAM protein [Streptomyces sp. CB03238]|uniref:radical SAM/SPASM domain-containing protein n=1 Tax=Streptomyces sp. CB03238 TaxID=1907777 RepID=UPI000A0F962F|nr:radical SAM protein [Streptomyces sp. CB03238]ORT60100.1 hypothetical protein BKD26_10925 [Streptomyces sp. CB03238]